jgi:4-alpha-glucanotransferase
MLGKLKSQIHNLPLIAEDLGVITPEVEKLRDNFDLPGMKVLQFAFSSDATNKDLPHNYTQNFVVYTGTHDNDTTLGWLKSLKGEEKKQVCRYVGNNKKGALHRLIDMAWGSCAKMAVIPLQDLLVLDEKARMNTPGTASGNWGWRFRWSQLRSKYKRRLKELTEMYNR